MKKFIAILLTLLGGHAKAESPGKLGSDSDPIRQLLFASQSLKEQVSRSHLDGNPSPFQTISDASKLVDEGKRSEAVSLLYKILDTRDLESRITLWVWAALRELGEKPEPQMAFQVIGVVIEFPSGGAYDTLAAYMDGSARYLNFSGKAIFWDQKEESIRVLCQSFIDSTIPASSRAKPRENLALPKSGGQVTLLTRSGNFVVTNPPDSVIGPAAALMTELIKRTNEKKNGG
jgi:hypothetical protein